MAPFCEKNMYKTLIREISEQQEVIENQEKLIELQTEIMLNHLNVDSKELGFLNSE